MNTKIICKSTGKQGSEFSIKLPKTLKIKKNSQIALIGGTISSNAAVNINETNNTFLVQFGSFDGVVEGTEDITDQLPPFFVKLDAGTYITTTVEDAIDGQGLYFTELQKAFNNYNPYPIFQFQVEMTGPFNLGCYVTVCDTTISAIPTLNQSDNNLTDIQIVGNVDKAEITDTAGGFLYTSEELMVVPAVNQKKDSSISMVVPQADYERLFFGYALSDKQEDYLMKEPYNIDKSWVGLFKTEAGETLSGPSATTAALYTNQLPVSIEVIDGTFQIKVLGIGEDGYPDPENVTLTDSGVNPNAQASLVKVKIEMVVTTVDGKDYNQINLHLQIDNNGTGANLSNNTVKFPTHWLGKPLIFAGCQDSGQAQQCDLQLLTIDRLDTLAANAQCGLDEAAGNGGDNLNVTLIYNQLPQKFVIDDAEPFFSASDSLINMSRKCNHNFLMAGKNYSFIEGTATQADPSVLTYNNLNNAADMLSHIQILNLPIDSYVCDPYSGDIQNIIHSFVLTTSDSNFDLEPKNIVYCKLKNKQDITINNLDFRIVDSEGKIQTMTINTTHLILHLKQQNIDSSQMIKSMTENQKSLMDYFEMVKNKLS